MAAGAYRGTAGHMGYKILRGKLRRNAVGICRLEYGRKNLGTIATEALTKYFPGDDEVTDMTTHGEIRRRVAEGCGKLAREEDKKQEHDHIDKEVIGAAIWSLNPRKAPGRDGIRAYTLRDTWAELGVWEARRFGGK